MRSIGHLATQEHAVRFGDYLFSRDIENQVEPDGQGQWTIWVMDEERLEEAGEAIKEFEKDPEAEPYLKASRVAEAKREEIVQEEKLHQKRQFNRNRVWRHSRPVVTIGLVLLSLVVTFLTRFGANQEMFNLFAMTPVTELPLEEKIAWMPGLQEVRQGQVWRLVTPIFIHLGVLHILFNMMWVIQLGALIERRLGSVHLLVMVLVIAVLSNLLEYTFTSPNFGGMSGVVFGLFGFLWARGKYDPSFGEQLMPQTVVLVMLWFVLCITGAVGAIANFVHWGGLATGAIWGVASSFIKLHPRGK